MASTSRASRSFLAAAASCDFMKGEPGGHDQILGRQGQLAVARGFEVSDELVGQGQDRDARQIDLLAAGEIEQEVQGTLEPVEIDDEAGDRAIARLPVHHQPATRRTSPCTNRTIGRRIEAKGLKATPISRRRSGRTKMTPRRMKRP
jgi:hypothetical protein